MTGEQQSIPEAEPGAAYNASSNGSAIILDVREPDEVRHVSVKNALHIPLGELQRHLDHVPDDRDIYVLCHVGQRSAMAADFLRHLGRERVWNIRGGIIGWLRSGLPVNWAENG